MFKSLIKKKVLLIYRTDNSSEISLYHSLYNSLCVYEYILGGSGSQGFESVPGSVDKSSFHNLPKKVFKFSLTKLFLKVGTR